MIQLKKIEIYIVEEDIQNILLHVALDKKSFKKTQIQNTPLHTFSIEKGLNKFHFGIVQSMMMTTTFETLSFPIYTNSDEYLSLEFELMNHCH
jgi:hypothetical protein